MSIKVFDFFSGCGGTSAGLRQARYSDKKFEIVFGLDNNTDAADTFKKNFKRAKFKTGDIRTVKCEELQEIVDGCEGHPLLFAGCAPCQPFSTKNSSRGIGEDKRRDLLQEFGRFVEHFKPDYVLVENVPGIQEIRPGTPGPLNEFLELLGRNGYRYKVGVLKSQDYGVPQRRARLIVLATRHGNIHLPETTHGPGKKAYVTAWEVIKDLPKVDAGEKHPTIPNHQTQALTPRNLERIKATPAGGDRRDWPDALWLDCHKGRNNEGKFDGHMDVYGRIRKDQPMGALTTRFISISNGRFGHPVQDRALTVREAAYIQTFPKSFEFCGPLGSTAVQVGNAVPVLLAQRLGEVILRHATEKGLNATRSPRKKKAIRVEEEKAKTPQWPAPQSWRRRETRDKQTAQSV